METETIKKLKAEIRTAEIINRVKEQERQREQKVKIANFE